MLGTVINVVLLRGRLAAMGEEDVRLMTAIPISIHFDQEKTVC